MMQLIHNFYFFDCILVLKKLSGEIEDTRDLISFDRYITPVRLRLWVPSLIRHRNMNSSNHIFIANES